MCVSGVTRFTMYSSASRWHQRESGLSTSFATLSTAPAGPVGARSVKGDHVVSQPSSLDTCFLVLAQCISSTIPSTQVRGVLLSASADRRYGRFFSRGTTYGRATVAGLFGT